MTHPNTTMTPKPMNTANRLRWDHEAVKELANKTPETTMLPRVVTAAGKVNAKRTSPNVAGVGNPP